MISNADIKHTFQLAGLVLTDINLLSPKSDLPTILQQTRYNFPQVITGRFILPGVNRP